MAAMKPRPSLALTFLRLFAVQGSWNYERMLGLGVGVAEEALLKDLRRDGDETAYRAAVARGARFFNAHPYLAGLAVGATARAEHEAMPPAQIERLRHALVGPLGALGDQLVWAAWLPLLASAALAAIALGANWIAVLAFVLVYNVGHVALRWWALSTGWASGKQVVSALQSSGLQGLTRWTLSAMALVTGFALPLIAYSLAGPFGGWQRLSLAVVAVVGFVVLRLFASAVDGLRLGLTVVAIALIAGWLWP
jgi:PTS system mannose-specific IID component